MKKFGRKSEQQEGIEKNLGYLLEHDKKALSNLLLTDAKIMAELIATITSHDDLSEKALAFLKSKYCSQVVANSLEYYIKQIVDGYLEIENPTKGDMATVYRLMVAATLILVYQYKK